MNNSLSDGAWKYVLDYMKIPKKKLLWPHLLYLQKMPILQNLKGYERHEQVLARGWTIEGLEFKYHHWQVPTTVYTTAQLYK